MANLQNTKSRKGRVVWLYGRPCAGKTTIGQYLLELLKEQGLPVITLDGDELRESINSDLGFSLADRHENIRRSSEMAKVLSQKGFDVICSFVTPTHELRELIRKVNQDTELYLIFIDTPIEKCISRDTKGHYKKASEGSITDFTGIGSPFDEPALSDPDVVIHTSDLSIAEIADRCLEVFKTTITTYNQ